MFIISEQVLAPLILIIPFYFLLKIAFFVYLFLPETNGAIVVFEKVIKPIFLKNKSRIDAAVNRGKEKVGEFVEKATKKVD